MAEKLRFGIIGMGIGRSQGMAFVRNPRAEVTALCDLSTERMEALAKDLPTRPAFFTDYHEMLASDTLDAVFVGTPNQLHAPVARAAVANKKHVLVTKPLADSLEPARLLVAEAEAAGVVNMMSLSTRFDAQVQYVGRAVARGEFGTPYYARARSVRRTGIPNWNTGFIAQGGGAFRDVGVHMLDSVWWMLGRPKPISVSGVAGAVFGPRGRGYWNYAVPPAEYVARFASDDYAGGFIRFEGNIGLQIESFWASHQAEESAFEIFGDEAGAKMTMGGPAPITIYRTLDGAPNDNVVKMPDGIPNAWDNIAAHFTACVLDGVPCEAPLRDGLVIQQMLEAVLASAESGREFRFDVE